MKKVITVCDVCGKEIKRPEVTLTISTNTPHEFCFDCGENLIKYAMEGRSHHYGCTEPGKTEQTV